MLNLALTLLLFLSTVGCVIPLAGRNTADPKDLPARAAFDMQCPEQDVQLSKLSEDTYGAVGCGKQWTYVSVCSGGSEHVAPTCSWVRS